MANQFEFNIPSFIDSEFYISKLKKIKLKKLKIKLTNKTSRKISTYLPIEETPHFSFVENYLLGKKERICLDYKNYKEYNEYNGHYLDEENFKNLIDSIISKGFQEKDSKIICLKNFYNPFYGSFKVLDGSHRLAILLFLNFKDVNVAIAKHKKNFVKRKLNFLKKIYF